MTTTLPYFDAEAVRRGTPMPDLVAALRAGFAGDAVAPARHAHVLGGEASLLLMPAWVPGGDLGLKVTVVDRAASPAVRASYLLMDQATAVPVAVLDGTVLTARRTAAASALAADYLARPDAETLLVLGSGALAPVMVEAHAAVRPIKRILVWARDPAKGAALADTLVVQGLDARSVAEIEPALRLADIVSAATLARTPLIRGAALKPGAHVDLVGAFQPDMGEADGETFARCRVFVDTFGGALTEAGDLLKAIAAGHLTTSDIQGDLKTLCRGDVPGRRDADELTLFKSVGTALEDLAAARLVVSRHA